MFRRIFIIVLLAFFVIPLPARAIIDSAKVDACIKLGCAAVGACSAFESGGKKDSDGNYYCLSTPCKNGDSCVFVDRKCNVEDDCTGYSTQEGGQACLNNHCYLDAVGRENYDKGGTVGFTDIKVDLRIKEPKLAITIPGLNFSKLSSSTITQENGKTYLNIPYIAEYLAAAYKVGLTVISIIAVVMIIVTGIKIIVSGGEAKVEGFKKIGQIAIGLFIGWGSFTILNIVNPNLVNFKALRVQYIDPKPIELYDSLTSEDFADAALGEGSPDRFKYFTECPIKDFAAPIVTLADNPNRPNPIISKNLPRRLEFHEKMVTRQILQGPISQRVAMASEAAVLCKIHYENCGVGTTNVLALATATGGSYGKSEKCLKYSQKKGETACNSTGYSVDYSPKTNIHTVLNEKTSYDGLTVNQIIRGMWCGSVPKCDAQGVKKRWPGECLKTPKEATDKLVSILQSTGKWDVNWINDLKPGDYYMIINWNEECDGAHSALFLGWKDPAKHIAWVQMGSWKIFINIGTRNLEGKAIVQISRPNETN